MGVVNESAYFLRGSPACIALVDKDLQPLLTLCFFDALAIYSLSNKALAYRTYSSLNATSAQCLLTYIMDLAMPYGTEFIPPLN